MSDIHRKSALRQDGAHAPGIVANGLAITEYRPDFIAQINGARDPATLKIALSASDFDCSKFTPGHACQSADSTVLWNGPGMWMLVCENSINPNLINELNVLLQDTDATVTELSQSRTILTIEGENLLDFLYTGCPVDLDNRHPDSCFSTQFGHFNVLIHLRDPQHANMYVYRSFGQALWDHCHHISGEF